MNTAESDQGRWFSEQIQPHESSLRAWLQSRFPSVRRMDADDIVQEAYIRVLKAREQRGELQRPKAFLFTTVRNLTLDLLRHRKVAHEVSLVDGGAWNVMEDGDSIPETVARRQEFAFLTEAIQSLPDRCREVFTLRKFHGLSQKEIAAKLGISEHTVSAQLTISIHKCTEFVTRCRRERASQ